MTGQTVLPTSPTPVIPVPQSRPKGFEPRKDFSSFINYEDEYDEGEVTGFAVSWGFIVFFTCMFVCSKPTILACETNKRGRK